MIACDFSTQKGLTLSDGMCAFSQEGGEWFRTNEKTSQYGPSGDHTNGTSKCTGEVLVNVFIPESQDGSESKRKA